MIRTVLSFIVLFGSLLFVNHAIHHSIASEDSGIQTSRPAPDEDVPILDESLQAGSVRTTDDSAVRSMPQTLVSEPVDVATSDQLPQRICQFFERAVTAAPVSVPDSVAADPLFDAALQTLDNPDIVDREPSILGPTLSGPAATVDLIDEPKSEASTDQEPNDSEALATEQPEVVQPSESVIQEVENDIADVAPVEEEPTLLESLTEDGPQQPSSATALQQESAAAVQSEQPAEVQSPTSSSRRGAGGSVAPRVTLSSDMLARQQRVERCLATYYYRPDNAATRSPWGLMHAMLSFGVDTEIIAGRQRVNAATWLCMNRPGRGMQLMYTTRGQLRLRNGPGYQGHDGQLLAMLGQIGVQHDYPLQVGRYRFTVQDLVDHEMKTCKANTELTFKLIGLCKYIDTETQWKDQRGQAWNFSRLLQEELKQKVIGAACGGTHRMMGFSVAVDTRRKEGRPMTGQWLRAEKYVNAYIDYAFRLQNRDGSFSTEWFKGRGNKNDMDRKIQTTGHILEWLIYSLPQERRTDDRVVRAVDYIANSMSRNTNRKWDIGPKAHALRALLIYDELVFGADPVDHRARFAELIKNRRYR